jgi:hypothetical protein
VFYQVEDGDASYLEVSGMNYESARDRACEHLAYAEEQDGKWRNITAVIELFKIGDDF